MYQYATYANNTWQKIETVHANQMKNTCTSGVLTCCSSVALFPCLELFETKTPTDSGSPGPHMSKAEKLAMKIHP